MKPQTVVEAIWTVARAAEDCREIVRKHDEIAASGRPIVDWSATLNAKFEAAVARAAETGKIEAAEAAVDAFLRRQFAPTIAREVESAAGGRAYRYIREASFVKKFEKMGRRILAAISDLPPTQSRREARDRLSIFQQIERELEAMEAPGFELDSRSFFVCMTRGYAAKEQPPAPQIQVQQDPDFLSAPIEPPKPGKKNALQLTHAWLKH